MQDERSVMERWFGDSWETTLAGWGGAGMGIILVILGRLLAVPDLIAVGVVLIGTAAVAVGQLARSKGASAAAKKERLVLHEENVQAIQEVKGQVADVADLAKVEAREIATQVAERTVEAHKG